MTRGIAQKVTIAGAVLVTVCALLFPPWVHTLDANGFRMTRPGIYAPIYRIPDPVPKADLTDIEELNIFWSVQLDYRRLGIELGIIWVVAAFALYLLRANVKSGS